MKQWMEVWTNKMEGENGQIEEAIDGWSEQKERD